MDEENVGAVPEEQPVATPPQAPQQAPPAPEAGPMNMVVACTLVGKKYGAPLNTVRCMLDPIVHEGSVANFHLVNIAAPVAQARLRFSPTPVFDADGNATVAMYFCEISYPPNPFSVQLRQ